MAAPSMKEDRMNKIILTAAFAVLAGSAVAQTNNMTASSVVNPYLATAPVTGYISATVTSLTAPVAATLPSTSKTRNAVVCNVRDSSGNPKQANITVSSTTSRVVIATSNQNSSTIAVGDVLNCFISYER